MLKKLNKTASAGISVVIFAVFVWILVGVLLYFFIVKQAEAESYTQFHVLLDRLNIHERQIDYNFDKVFQASVSNTMETSKDAVISQIFAGMNKYKDSSGNYPIKEFLMIENELKPENINIGNDFIEFHVKIDIIDDSKSGKIVKNYDKTFRKNYE